MFATEFAVIKITKRKVIKMERGSFMSGEEEPDLSEVCMAGGDLIEFNARRLGPGLRKLDLSFNVIQRMKGLELSSSTLEEIIIDNNQLQRLELRGSFPKLHTLSLNKNMIYDLTNLVSTLKRSAPGLRYLSLLGNPACPDRLSSDDIAESDYQQYRLFIIHHLPNLRFLDYKQISQYEFRESQRPSHKDINFYQQASPLPQAKKQKSVAFAGNGKNEPNKSRQGKRRYKYVGKNSEGNRFIKDMDL